MFNINKYTHYLEQLFEYTPKKYSKIDILSALVDFNTPEFKTLNTTSQNCSSLLRKLFSKSIKNKPISVAVKDYMLYLYKFKHCSKCNNVKEINDFYTNIARWNNLEKICKSCCSKKFSNYYAEYHDKERMRDKKYKQQHGRFNNAKRRAAKNNATPEWLSSEDWQLIENNYTSAKDLEIKYGFKLHIDHIIPLQGKDVCGLHVPWNLQMLSQKQNLEKSNKI